MTQRWLEANQATGELRLIITDYHDGRHDRDEFRVVNADGRPIRAARLPEVHGLPVDHRFGPAGSEYTARPPTYGHLPVNVETYAVGPTQTTPCPKAENRRRKCELCAAAAARAA